ncbi:MAG: FAD/NAD(P)-binding protein [Moheibacter sp.]
MNPKKMAIIGGGFTGIMTITHLVENIDSPIEILLFDKIKAIRGIAYNPYSEKHLLNVAAGKMSAYPTQPDDFVNWVMEQKGYEAQDKTFIQTAFLTRSLYGRYLENIWKQTQQKAKLKNILISMVDSYVTDLDVTDNGISLTTENNREFHSDYCVIATGNHIPRNPPIENSDFYRSRNYFQNPWRPESVKEVDQEFPVLIIGNGLTMVDTVFGLLENEFEGNIFSISPNGFNILPHQSTHLTYSGLTEELTENPTLREILSLVKRHIKILCDKGISAIPVIDSLRPLTPKIWEALTEKEKHVFMRRLRHLWGVARHRLPMESYDKIQSLRKEKLHIISGKIINFTESEGYVVVEYFDKKESRLDTLKVSRVINCTGPESDLLRLNQSFLKKCLEKEILYQDKLKLGIRTDTETFQIIRPNGNPHSNLFTLGTNLKGELWESTAVPELRVQTQKLAETIYKLMQDKPLFVM